MISTNYSKSDWYRFIAAFLVKSIPMFVFIVALTLVILPVMDDGILFMRYHVETDLLGFLSWVEENDLEYSYALDYGVFIAVMFLGGSTILIFVSISLMRLFPRDWIVQKLDIAPRMKMVIFWNGEPRFQEK